MEEKSDVGNPETTRWVFCPEICTRNVQRSDLAADQASTSLHHKLEFVSLLWDIFRSDMHWTDNLERDASTIGNSERQFVQYPAYWRTHSAQTAPITDM